jgi:AraC-like DNA-binding protein
MMFESYLEPPAASSTHDRSRGPQPRTSPARRITPARPSNQTTGPEPREEWHCAIKQVRLITSRNLLTSATSLCHHELILVTDGNCSFLHNGVSVRLKAGQLYLLAAGDAVDSMRPHATFTASVVDFHLIQRDCAKGILPVEFTPGLQHLTSDSLLIPAMLKKIERSAAKPGKKSFWKENAWLNVALLEMLELVSPDTEGDTTRYAQKLHLLCESIRKDPHLTYNNEELANEINLSRGHFVRLFRQCQGVSPREFVIQSRIEKGKLLLKTTLLNISEIAAATGYGSVYHFSRQFSQKVGTSPTDYRKAECAIY